MASRLFEGKNVMKTLKNIIQRCEICQKHNPKTEKLAKSGLQRSGNYPGEDGELDFTHMPKANGYSCLQVWADTFTEWILLNGRSATTFYALLNKKSLVQTHICKKSALTHSPPQQRLSELQALQSQVSDANGFSIFPVLRNPDAQGHIIPQYDGIKLFLHATNDKGCNYVWSTFSCH